MIREGGSWSGRERNCAFLNTGDGRFADVSAVAGWDFPDDGRSLAVVDWDLDGALDVWVSNRNGPRVRFLKNAGLAENRYLAVRLIGETCNRDAIGARVELVMRGESPRRSIQTVHAGEGYLAQSSRWIHFGLGKADEPEKLVVHWPGGTAEEFAPLAPDTRYVMRQGSGIAKRWDAPRKSVSLPPSVPVPPPVSDRARIVLGAPVPMPAIEYQRADGSKTVMVTRTGKPVLINIWASWCTNCQAELAEFSRNPKLVGASGLQILALSADEPETRKAAASKLKSLRWPYQAGYATAELLGVLDALQRALLDRKRPLPIPTSFLVDSRNRLAVIYKGPVEVETLLQDVASLGASLEKKYELALPFAGRWLGPPRQADLVRLAQEFNKRGYPSVAKQYLAGTDALQDRELAALDDGTRDRLASAAYSLGTVLFEDGKQEEGLKALRRALEIDPNYWRAHQNLGFAFDQVGNHAEAIEHFEALLRLQPALLEVHLNLGRSLAAMGRYDEARSHFEELRRARPTDGPVLLNLGMLNATQGRMAEAIRSLLDAVLHNPDDVPLRLTVAKTLLQMRQLGEAVKQFDEVIARNPTLSEAYSGKGAGLAGQGMGAEAIVALRQALVLEPQSTAIATQLGGVLVQQRAFPEAITLLSETLTRNPTDGLAVFHLSLAYLGSGDRASALQQQGRLATLDPAHAAQLLAIIEQQ